MTTLIVAPPLPLLTYPPHCHRYDDLATAWVVDHSGTAINTTINADGRLEVEADGQ